VRYAVYLISFIHHGLKEINKEDSHLDEIIPENATAEIVTQSEAERSLLGILRLWGGLSEVVPLGDKWKGGTELRPNTVGASFVTFALLGYPAVQRQIGETKRSAHRCLLS